MKLGMMGMRTEYSGISIAFDRLGLFSLKWPRGDLIEIIKIMGEINRIDSKIYFPWWRFLRLESVSLR